MPFFSYSWSSLTYPSTPLIFMLFIFSPHSTVSLMFSSNSGLGGKHFLSTHKSTNENCARALLKKKIMLVTSLIIEVQ